MQDTKKINPILMAQYNAILQLSTTESTNNIKEKILQFEEINNIKEAKLLFKELFPDQEGKQTFFIDGVEINVCIENELFRISTDTTDEFFLYEYNS